MSDVGCVDSVGGESVAADAAVSCSSDAKDFQRLKTSGAIDRTATVMLGLSLIHI